MDNIEGENKFGKPAAGASCAESKFSLIDLEALFEGDRAEGLMAAVND